MRATIGMIALWCALGFLAATNATDDEDTALVFKTESTTGIPATSSEGILRGRSACWQINCERLGAECHDDDDDVEGGIRCLCPDTLEEADPSHPCHGATATTRKRNGPLAVATSLPLTSPSGPGEEEEETASDDLEDDAPRDPLRRLAEIDGPAVGARVAAVEPKPTDNDGKESEEDLVSIVFLSDLEEEYRGHKTYACENIVAFLKDLAGSGLRYGGAYTGVPITPDLVIHGGDISDTTYHWDQDPWGPYEQLVDAGIPFVSIGGNHDTANGGADAAPVPKASKFVAETFRRAAATDDRFVYHTVAAESSNPDFYLGRFRGAQFATVNHKLADPNTDQWRDFRAKLETNTDKPTLFFSHSSIAYPDTNGRHDPAYADLVASAPAGSASFAGHKHRALSRQVVAGSNGITEFVAPYPHHTPDAFGVPPGFYAVLWSPSRGLLDVATINYDYQEVTGCWEAGTRCGPGTTCNYCCPYPGDPMGYYEFWEGKVFTACGREPCWDRGTVCVPYATCTSCCNDPRSVFDWTCN